jgi:hypothetical protein
MRLREGGGLLDERAKPRVNEFKLEQKAPVAAFGVRDGERAGRQPARQAEANAAELHEVVPARKINA